MFDRFIPTYVGHTAPRRSGQGGRAVHPHIRGAYQRGQTFPPCFHGSSPHTWGIHFKVRLGGSGFRFIPTYVGHTVKRVPPGGVISGSSPHTWGIQALSTQALCAVRFIPTYVGHTCRRVRCWSNPHGSSPHTWGIHIRNLRRRVTARFIPTYVGHTYRRSAGSVCPSVHPHIRGAYWEMFAW